MIRNIAYLLLRRLINNVGNNIIMGIDRKNIVSKYYFNYLMEVIP
jgi:hypothetical protein